MKVGDCQDDHAATHNFDSKWRPHLIFWDWNLATSSPSRRIKRNAAVFLS
ncbi:hypothetical protein THTE_2074 [Thermogutta terrifontis]|uniref:Uncharacterized protein n=1 Tax=Thermogutta terrifontis TaxID=1331910 RepID=A0A286RFD7_9BACT|nr:hypothetical protein THTE_2074 [Thermogutta terrifontis]